MDKKDKVNKAMNQAYGVDGKLISNNKKHYYKKNFSKKRNWVVIVNLILKIIEVGALIAIWYELFLNNSVVFD